MAKNFVKCSISKIREYQTMLKRSHADLIKSIEVMEHAIRKVEPSWQDDVFASIKEPLRRSDNRLQAELETLKSQVGRRLEEQEKWLDDYLKTAR